MPKTSQHSRTIRRRHPAAGPPALLRRWGLTPEAAPIRTATGVVQFVRRNEERLVLKRIIHADEAGQGAVLAHYRGQGAVRLVARCGPVLLMERALPGRPLSDLVRTGRDDEATRIVGEMIAALHIRPPPTATFRTVEVWVEGFDRVRPQALAEGADPALIDRAQGLYRDLSASQSQRRLLHGDLHHDNILQDAARGWLAIDPKGVLGESAYEAGAMLRNPIQQPWLYADPMIIGRRAAILAERLELDHARILGWCFAQAVLSALWFVEDGVDAAPAWRMAEATLPLTGQGQRLRIRP